MTKIDPASFNAGIATMISIARRSAEEIKTDPRRIPIAFAVAALDQLATDGSALLIRPAGAAATPADPTSNPSPESPAAAMAAE